MVSIIPQDFKSVFPPKEELFLEKANKGILAEPVVIYVPPNCLHPPLVNGSSNPFFFGQTLAFAQNQDYNVAAAHRLDELSKSIDDIKAALARLGLMHLDKRIEGLSDAQILPEEGEDNMARLRGRVAVEQKTVMISASSPQELINKALEVARQLAEVVVAKHPEVVPLFGDYATDWLKTFSQPKVEKTTFAGYKSYLKTQLIPAFGNLRLDEITVNTVQDFITSQRKNHTLKTVKNYVKLLSLILQAAVEDELIQKDVTKSSRITYPKSIQKVREALLEEELLDIVGNIDKLKHEDQLLLALLIFTAARRGEVLGLKAKDIDLENGLLHFERQARFPATNRAEVVEYLKMNKPGRDIPILKQLAPYLPKDQDDRFLIGDGKTPLTQQQFRNTWTRIGKTIDLHGATPHVLRHTFLTYACNHGVDPKTLQALAGHSSVAFTLNQYVHTQKKQLQKAGELLSESLNQR